MTNKKILIIVSLLLVSFLLAGCWLFPEKLTIPEVDGIVNLGEWDDATEIPVAGDMGIVKVLATTDYLYVLFDVEDSTDARLDQGGGNDQTGLNINPTEGGSWGKPYNIVFQTGSDPSAFTTTEPKTDISSSGQTDDWETEWVIDGVQLSIPLDLETITIYSEGMRVSEWKVPLATIEPSAGDVLKIGGSVPPSSFTFPIDLDWSIVSTYVNIIVH